MPSSGGNCSISALDSTTSGPRGLYYCSTLAFHHLVSGFRLGQQDHAGKTKQYLSSAAVMNGSITLQLISTTIGSRTRILLSILLYLAPCVCATFLCKVKNTLKNPSLILRRRNPWV